MKWQAWPLNQQLAAFLAPATGFMEDNFSVDGRGDGSGSHESSAGYGAGSNGSDR